MIQDKSKLISELTNDNSITRVFPHPANTYMGK